MPPLSIIVSTAGATAQGDGPISTAVSWSYTQRLDQAGDCSLSMPATDPRAALLVDPDTLHYVHAQTTHGTVGRANVGAGIIKEVGVGSDTRMLRASGPDLAGELMHTSVGALFLHGAGEDDPMAAADVFPAVMADSLSWVVVDVAGDPSEPSKDIEPYQFGDETHLAALGKLAELTGDHWRLITPEEQESLVLGPRHIIWLPTTVSGFDAAASGLRAIDSGETTALDGNPEVCLIVGGLEEVRDEMQRCTRIRARGGGNQDARLYLNGTTRFSANPGSVPGGVPGDFPSGDFTLHIDAEPDKSYLVYDPGEPTSADVIEAVETFRDIAPLNDSSAAAINASNALFDATLVRLRQRIFAQTAYRLRVTKVHMPLRVGETLHVICRHWTDGFGWIQVNTHLMMLSVQTTYEALAGEPIVQMEVTE